MLAKKRKTGEDFSARERIAWRNRAMLGARGGIQIGDVVTGTADGSGSHQRFRFTLTDPQRLLFDSRTGNTGLYWNMSGPQGAERYDTNFYYADGYLYGNSPVLTQR